MGVEGIVLEHHGDIPVLWGDPVDQDAVDVDLPFGDLLQPCYHPQCSGLSAAGRTYQDDELLVGNLQVEVLDCHHVPIVYLFDMS